MTGPGDTVFAGRDRSGTAYEPLTSSPSAAASTPMKARRSARAPARRSCTNAVVVNTCAVTAEAVRQSRQAIRKLQARAARARASSSPAAPRRSSRRPMPPWPKSIRCWAIAKSSTPRAMPISASARRAGARQRHHERARNRAPDGRSVSTARAAPSCRCRTAATIAAPSASFPMAGAIRAACRWARWSKKRAAWPKTALPKSC